MRISSTIHPIMSFLNSADIHITWFISYILALLASIRHNSQQINLVHDSFVEVQFKHASAMPGISYYETGC